MCVVCVTITAGSLLLSPVQPASNLNENVTFTKKPCSKSKLNKTENNLICLKNGKTYRWAINNKSTEAKGTVETFKIEPPQDVSNCKLMEPNKIKNGLPTGFSQYEPPTQRSGEVTWALIPIQFSDVRGSKDLINLMNEQMEKLTLWYKTVSHGKLNIKWRVHDKWITLPGKSSDYEVPLSDSPDRSEQITNFWLKAISESDKYFDYSNIQIVNFILPTEQTVVKESLQGFPWDKAVREYATQEGKVQGFSIPGAFFNQHLSRYWFYWAHEFGHSIGLPHIGPSRGGTPDLETPFNELDLMGMAGASNELSGWLRWLAGWMPDSNIYCKTYDSIKETSIKLLDLNNSNDGYKLIVIPVSQTKALLIENRKDEWYNCKTSTKREGFLAYYYDSNYGHGERFLVPIEPLSREKQPPLNCATIPTIDYLFKANEVFYFEKLKITINSAGDTVTIQKNN